jgi:oligoribonuclease NrnB/cAMP/cGMP phosphodiesterase (DHH superfamily)
MAEVAASMMVLDHHKSAIEALANIPVAQSTWEGHLSASALEQEKPDGAPIAAVFDMERSGAVIAWQYFHPNIVVPWLFRYVQDRDLWRFALPYTREISAALFSYDYDFNTWSSLHLRLETDNSYSRLLTEGKGIERKHHKDIRELLDATRREMTIGGHVVPVANMPYTMASDAANIMAEGQPFAATYYETSSGRLAFSLRSAEDGADVSEIAKMYGGGGHKHAAGFSVPAGTILLPQTP